jgi:tetratricopeptide (TPR) repeat protein
MNDLLAMYSRDAQLNLEAGVWLSYQGEHEAAAKFLTRALEVDPKFAVALNINGYNLAAMRGALPARPPRGAGHPVTDQER